MIHGNARVINATPFFLLQTSRPLPPTGFLKNIFQWKNYSLSCGKNIVINYFIVWPKKIEKKRLFLDVPNGSSPLMRRKLAIVDEFCVNHEAIVTSIILNIFGRARSQIYFEAVNIGQ